MFPPPQVPTLGPMMEEFLLFDLEKSVDQWLVTLLFQEVQIQIQLINNTLRLGYLIVLS